MNYAEGLREVLIRKINKAERDLHQLKLDYCRFVYGISHRSRVTADDGVYLVKSVDLDSMSRLDTGEWSKPRISGVKLGQDQRPIGAELVLLDRNWDLLA